MTVYPSKSWPAYEIYLKNAGEYRPVDGADKAFLQLIGFVSEEATLTVAGQRYFELKYIQRDSAASATLLQESLLSYPPASAICQLLAGIPSADRDSAETVLRSQGMGDSLTARKLGTLLSLMAAAGLIKYVGGKITILLKPASRPTAPPSIFISRGTPFGNKVWLRRILEECDTHLYWLDKHFMHPAFEALWEAADGARISEIKIVSLKLEQNSGRRAMRDYRDLREELAGRSITLEWRFIDSTLIKDTHDRWIIGSSTARNVPDVGTIFSGNNSELNRSDQAKELAKIFQGYWEKAVPVIQ